MADTSPDSSKDFSDWLDSPDVEKAEWINSAIKKLWPFIGSFVHSILTGKVQKLVRGVNPLLFDFTFTNVSLGTKPPRVEGIKVFKDDITQKDEIVVEVNVKYDGDLDVDIAVVKVPAGIKDVKFEGIIRLGLYPLINTKPLVGALLLTFIDEPLIEFNLTGLANVLDAPGISDIVRDAINKAISSLIVYPQKQIVKLSPTVDISLLLYPFPQGVARIHVIDAEKLPDEDFFAGDSDPYVVVKVGLRETFKTKTIDDSNNPKWNQTFDAAVLDAKRGKIEFEVYDDEGSLLKADFLGKASVAVKSLSDQGVIDEKVSLRGVKKSGKLHLRLEWFDLSSDPKDLKKKDPKEKSNCAVLAMYIKNATNLTQNEKNPPSSYVKIIVPGMDALKTKLIKDTNAPVWEKYFQVFLKNPEEDEILLTIVDAESEKSLGELKYSVKSLLSAKNLTVEKPFSLDQSVPNAVLNARFTLKLMKAKPATSAAPSSENFEVTSGKPKETNSASSSA